MNTYRKHQATVRGRKNKGGQEGSWGGNSKKDTGQGGIRDRAGYETGRDSEGIAEL